MSIPKHCDVVVIGGGPAGSLLSALLAQKGYHIVVLDKQKHPRYHVGESLIPHFWKYTDAAGVSDRILSEGFVRKAGGMVNWHGQVRTHDFVSFGHPRPALHVERDIFDLILLENAREKGARVHEQVAVVRADFDGDYEARATYRTKDGTETGTIRSRFVVDATGQNALLGRQLGVRVVDQAFRYMSVWGYFRGARYVDAQGRVHPEEHVSDAAPTTFVSSLDKTGDAGWSWHILLRGSTSVGLVVPLEEVQAVKARGETWESYFLRTCRDIPIMSQLLEGAEFIGGSLHLINDYSYRSTKLAGPGFFLIGDAAGFIDPIFSVGVVLGFYGAFAASWAIHESLRKPGSAVRNRQQFAHQMHGRIELARSLALPRISSPDEEISDLAKAAVRLERSNSHELMQAVTMLTTRSDNFVRLLDGVILPVPDGTRVRTVGEIAF